MDWASIAGSLIPALLLAVGVPLALRKRKKTSSQNVEQLLHHLQEIGVKASLLEKGAAEEKVGMGRASGQRSEGVIKIEGKNTEYINIVSVVSQYTVQYFLYYLVRHPDWLGQKRKKTKMVKKKSSGIRGKVIDIEWKGDDYLCQGLNYDYRLKDKLLQTEPGELKGGIQIFPEPKYEYARIRTPYLLPSLSLFEAIDIIAGHVKSGW